MATLVVVHLHIVGFVNGGVAFGGAVGHQVAGDFGLAVDHHMFALGVLVQIDAMALARKQQLKAPMNQAFCVQTLAHADFVQQINGDLLQHARTDASQHIVAALSFHNNVVNARFAQQSAQQQTRGASTNNSNLSSHVCLLNRCSQR